MRIAIISDTHDNVWDMDKAFGLMKDIDMIIHCGDFCAPFSVMMLEALGVPVHVVFGNTDDEHSTTKICEKSNVLTLHGRYGELVADGVRIFFTHYPHVAEAFLATGRYDLVLHGHTHKKRMEMHGDALLLCPGEILGRESKPSFAVYDTKTRSAEFVEFEHEQRG